MTGGWGFFGTIAFWTVVIFVYYIFATLLPIDKLIGRIYPLFGFALLVMAVGVLYGIFANEGAMPEITEAFSNHHPNSTLPIFPGLCITIACGAISGFHATQSPMMARCLKNEKLGRGVFYGAMITEGIVALIWAAAAIKFADSLNVAGATPYEKLLAAMTDPTTGKVNPAIIVNAICNSWIGSVGAVLAVLGVVVAPITSGDTAFRCARLIAADFLRIKQDKIIKRLLLCAPLFAISVVLMFVDFQILWRYFAWFNQSLSVLTLWAITVWLAKNRKFFYVTLIPALWMTMVCTTYILVAPEGFQLSAMSGNMLGGAITFTTLVLFVRWKARMK
jgi:carbon starvation protein CstA